MEGRVDFDAPEKEIIENTNLVVVFGYKPKQIEASMNTKMMNTIVHR